SRPGDPVIAAIDVGTTAAKAALVGRDGRVLASASRGYPTHTAAGGVVEQDPDQWWQGACRAMRDCRPEAFPVAALVVSGQMQNLIPLGADRPAPLRPAILYSDGRAVEE